MTLEEEVRELAKFAKAASVKLAQATTEERNGALLAMAAALRAQAAGHRGGQRRGHGGGARGRHHRERCWTGSCWTRSRVDCYGRRSGGGGGAARSARRRVAGMRTFYNGIELRRVIGAPRRGGHGLRGPAQRDRRRGRASA